MITDLTRVPPADKVFDARTTDEILAVMREEDEAARRERIVNKMTPECREKLAYIQTWMRREVDHMLRSRYELGLQVRELYEDERNNDGKLYGKNAIGRICTVLRWEDGVIRLALRFVQTYTADDLEHLCQQVLPNGEPLNWSHLRVLLQVKDATQRQLLLDKTVIEGWTCTDLDMAIRRAAKDGTGPDPRGRPPRLPRNFDDAVARQMQSAEQWERMYLKVWNDADQSLPAQAARLAPEEVTERHVRDARNLAYQLRHVAEQAQWQAERAEQVAKEFERILEERQRGVQTDPVPPKARGKAGK